MVESSPRAHVRTPGWAEPSGGLFRSIMASPGRRLPDVFENLPRHRGSQVFVQDTARGALAARLDLERSEGHGAWEFYRLDPGVYVVAGDFVYDQPRLDHPPGEGLVEFHLRLAGTLRLGLPGAADPLAVRPESLLVIRQPVGIEVSDRVEAGDRDTAVSVYCSPSFLQALAARNGVTVPESLAFAQEPTATALQYCVLPMSNGLLYVAHSLLRNAYHGGLRLLHAEAKVLELLCEALQLAAQLPPSTTTARDDELRRLDVARRIIITQYSPPPLIGDVARRVGMSETKLKRAFKARFGTTLYDLSVESRMRHALELLRCKRMSVGQVAYAVGYSHQTSFTTAFKQHFGFLPRAARQ
jgi:AraC-like DNA-binding protein